MKVIAINGSPRKNWNTDTLLKKTLEGAASVGAETEIVHLYDLTFRGCVSCLACKLQNGKSLGRCVLKDDLSPVLARLHEADAVVMGTPIYFSDVTGEMRCFIERFVFQYLNYDNFSQPLSPAKKTAMIYTMNCPAEMLEQVNYPTLLSPNEQALKMLFGYCETLCACNTYQFTDYSRYDVTMFKEEDKARQREEQFPKDLQKAYELGKRLVKLAAEKN